MDGKCKCDDYMDTINVLIDMLCDLNVDEIIDERLKENHICPECYLHEDNCECEANDNEKEVGEEED